MREPTPFETCKAALLVMGAPRDEVESLEPGRYVDALIHFFVMEGPGADWDAAKAKAAAYVANERSQK